MAAFSTAVKLGDLNDFIAPAQACVVSLQGQKQTAAKAPASQEPAIKVGQDGLQLNVRSSKRTAVDPSASNNAVESSSKKTGFQQTVVDDETQAIKVSLNDCLACSGCVTSAETVLLQHQSLKEFQAKCIDPDVIVVVSVSPQSRASLAALHGLDAADVQGRLCNFLKLHLSVSLVLDIGLGSALALTEAATEFVSRYQQVHELGPQQAAAPTAAAADRSSSPIGPLPLLASACPGWVCYAEKTHGSYILPHIATTRSPQGIMGSLIKQLLAQANGWKPEQVYHVTVMPCYDKKLEASRDDFLVPGTSIAEVDSCLTTGEVQELLEKYGFKSLHDVPGGRSDKLLQQLQKGHIKQQQQQQGHMKQQQHCLQMPDGRLLEPAMHSQLGSSGGYAQHIFKAAAKRLFGIDLDASTPPGVQLGQPEQLPFKTLRNADFQEMLLLGPSGEPLLRFAIAYGFRNIQTLVRKIKTGRCEYDYVEIMACPSGCLNGGGQIKAAAGMTAAQHIEQLELLYFVQQALAQQQQQQQQEQGVVGFTVMPGVIQVQQLHRTTVVNAVSSNNTSSSSSIDSSAGGIRTWMWAAPSNIDKDALAVVYNLLLQGPPGSTVAQQMLHTHYHKREKTVTSTLADW